MLQALLVDRFHLKFRRETKELPIYSLVVARKRAGLGPGLTEASDRDCTADPAGRFVVESQKLFGLKCGEFAAYSGQIGAVSVPLERLTPLLSRFMGREVTNKTGLTANYNIVLTWAPESTGTDGPSIFYRTSGTTRPQAGIGKRSGRLISH